MLNANIAAGRSARMHAIGIFTLSCHSLKVFRLKCAYLDIKCDKNILIGQWRLERLLGGMERRETCNLEEGRQLNDLLLCSRGRQSNGVIVRRPPTRAVQCIACAQPRPIHMPLHEGLPLLTRDDTLLSCTHRCIYTPLKCIPVHRDRQFPRQMRSYCSLSKR